MLLPASGLQHEVAAGRLQVVERMDAAGWESVFDLGRVEPGRRTVTTDDKGVAVWTALRREVGAGESGKGEGDEFVYGTRVRRSELADMALNEWAAAFLDPS